MQNRFIGGLQRDLLDAHFGHGWLVNGLEDLAVAALADGFDHDVIGVFNSVLVRLHGKLLVLSYY